MRLTVRLIPMLALAWAVACDSKAPTGCCSLGQPELRLVNAFTTPVNVTIDGQQVTAALAAGAIQTFPVSAGSHGLSVRGTNGASFIAPVTVSAGALSTIAVVRNANGDMSSAVLDDTNSVVPTGATKVRVIHFAPNAGTLQVYRTQPDFQTPTPWQTPFDYQPAPNSTSAPFLQSTVGTWEVRIWQTPADASGWANAPVKVVIPLASGEKKTVLMLDKPGGGVNVQLL